MSQMRADPLRIAVIGTGFGARVQLPGFMSMGGTKVVAVCGRQEDKTRAVAAEVGVTGVYTDYEQMLRETQPDVVSITAPPFLHKPMALAALQAGAHVLCEKPLALNMAEAQAMLDAAEQARRVHATDFEFRYLPAWYYQRVLVDQGYIGEPVLLEASYTAPWHWKRNRKWNWWLDKTRGGGMLGALGPHFIDAFRWLTGREVRAVTAVLHTPPPVAQRPDPTTGEMRDVTSDENAHLVLELDGGLQGAITLSAAAPGEAQRLAVHGTEGALIVRDHLDLWGRRQDDDALTPIPVPLEYEPPLWIPGENMLLGPFVKLVGLMVDRIRDRALIEPPTFHDGLAVQRVLDAAYQSAAQGRRVEVGAGLGALGV